MPWMYWSAISDALVGRDIHAGNTGHGLLSCRRSLADRLFYAISGRCSQTRTRRPSPWFSRGPASFENYPTWIRGLLKDSTWFRQPSLCFSSLFSDLFGAFPGLHGGTGPGTRRRPAGRLFRPLWPAWRPSWRSLAALPGGLCGLLGGRLPPIWTALPAAVLGRFGRRPLGRAGLPGGLGSSTAPIADRMRSISRVTCSMVIMPSTVSSLRRSE